MKRTSLVVLLFAAMTMGLTSCSKDDFDNADLPAFDKLATYLDRDASAVESEFKANGFDVYTSGSTMYAEDEDEINLYMFGIKNDKVTSAEYVASQGRPDPSTIKSQYRGVL